MADAKTSALTSLTGANVDPAADVLAVVDTSVTTTKKITVGELLKTTFNALFDISGSSGGQIKFPATQNASADANTLDDYEEGTWTPDFSFTTPGDLSVTYSTQAGTYTKIGRQVTATFNIVTSAFTHTTSSGSALINSFPFTSGSTYVSTGALEWSGITLASYTSFVVSLPAASASATIQACGSGQTAGPATASAFPTGGSVVLRGTITYTV